MNSITRQPANITRVILVRHGRSTYNEQGRFQGSCNDSVLTTKGKATAYRTGITLRNFDIDTVYTSPLKRAQQTTLEIVSALSSNLELLPSVRIADSLQEIHMATWQGLSYQYVKENFAEDYRCWQEQPHNFQVSVEGKPYFPVLELYKSARQFWQETLPKHPSQTILIAAHSGTNRALIGTAIGLNPERDRAFQQSNCGISILEFDSGSSHSSLGAMGAYNVKLTALNRTSHLGETLPKLKESKQGLRLLLLPSNTTEFQAKYLSEVLKETTLNFILSADLHQSRIIAEHFLARQSTAVHLQVLREDLPDAWQQRLLSRRASGRREEKGLVTGLLVAKETILQQLIDRAIGTQKIALIPGKLSILHYPPAGTSPILQALNFGGEQVSIPTVCSQPGLLFRDCSLN